MLGRKLIIPVFILSLLFANLFIVRSDAATAPPDRPQDLRSTEVVQLQQLLNNKGFWIGAVDGILSSKAYQEVMIFQIDTNLVADGLVGLQIRQAPSLAAIDSASASTPVVTENPTPPADTNVAKSTDSSNKGVVKLAEKPTSTVSRGTASSSRSGKVITMVSTGYDGCYQCNKPYYGKPSYIGLPLKHGIVAVDPDVIPMGTRLYVEGYGNAIAADQGNAINGNRIDLFFDSHQAALNYGMKTVKVTILN